MVASAAEANSENKGWLKPIHISIRQALEKKVRGEGEDKLQQFSDQFGKKYTEQWEEKGDRLVQQFKAAFDDRKLDRTKLDALRTVMGDIYAQLSEHQIYEGLGNDIILKEQEWIDKAIESTKQELNRAYKLKQAGSLFRGQPTGGFRITPTGPYRTLDGMVATYVKAMKDNEADFMIINEGFKKDKAFEAALQRAQKEPEEDEPEDEQKRSPQQDEQTKIEYVYDKLKDGNAILYKNNLTVISDDENIVTISRQKSRDIIKVAVIHTSSQGIPTTSRFVTNIEKFRSKKADVVCGDSNLTKSKIKAAMKKSNIPLQGENPKFYYSYYATIQYIKEQKGYAGVVSEHSIKKQRWPKDIILNNQVGKGDVEEVDGMFIFDLKPTKNWRQRVQVHLWKGTRPPTLRM